MNGRALVAWNLRRLRVPKGISQEALATDAGVDRTYVGRVERQIVSASVDLLDRLAVALDVHLSEFFVQPKRSERKPEALTAGRKAAPPPKRPKSA